MVRLARDDDELVSLFSKEGETYVCQRSLILDEPLMVAWKEVCFLADVLEGQALDFIFKSPQLTTLFLVLHDDIDNEECFPLGFMNCSVTEN
ncbi:hypothetical protein I3760_03G063500 [Carya illinoinensis]|uniref:Uncharacterized protein n=1 Tax=Carya illinoinensis TaxID=32201 RepID=A0A922JTV4_CARIL|nr:hypothetical protein I3760_03G063500 [Carya illinoinensis]KAG6720503.1 hypothetical protein I3842_03G066000 [Carya illinoinensis]